MTVSTTSSSVTIIGNGATTVFNFSFIMGTAGNAVVTYTDANGLQTVLSASQYTLVITPPAPGEIWGVGGTVTYPISGTPIANGTSLTIARVVPYTQTTDISNQGNFYPTVVETALDKLEMQIQQISAQASRPIQIPVVDSASIITTLPAAAARANKYVAFDSGGNVIVAGVPGNAPADLSLYYSTAAGSSVSRTFAARFSEVYDVLDYGADPTGAADSTTAIQACMTAAPYGSIINVPNGTYLLSATLNMTGACWLRGAGYNSTIFYRTGNYGDTIVCGTLAVPARTAHISGIWFQHSSDYPGSGTTLPNLATSGAHLRINGSQGALIEDCWFHRLVYNIYFDGGSWQTVQNCQFAGTFDPITPALQEGLSSVYFALGSQAWGTVNPTSWRVLNCEFLGSTVVRNVTYVASDRSVTVNNLTDTIGPTYGLRVDGGEDVLIEGNYFGGQSTAEIVFLNQTGSAIIDVRIVDNFFDGIAQGEQILFAPTIAGLYSLAVTIAGNQFTGGLSPVYINQNVGGGGSTSVYSLTIEDNEFFASIGCPIKLNGAIGFVVSGNTITNYNEFNVSLVDPLYCAALTINGFTAYGKVTDNIIGGGGNQFTQSALSNFCYLGTFLDPSMTTVNVGNNFYAGVGTTNYQVGLAVSENQKILTAAGNWQMTGQEENFIAKKTVGAATTVNLPLYPPMGRVCTIKDGKGDGAANNLTTGTADGTTIDGSATSVITTNYGFRQFRFNGTEWNRIA